MPAGRPVTVFEKSHLSVLESIFNDVVNNNLLLSEIHKEFRKKFPCFKTSYKVLLTNIFFKKENTRLYNLTNA